MGLSRYLPCSACRRRFDPAGAEFDDLKKLGRAHLAKGEHMLAVSTFSKAIRLWPADATAWLDRANVYQELEDWSQALRDASRAVQLDPKSERALYGKAFALRKSGKLAEAVKACADGLESHPRSKDLRRLQTELEEKETDSSQVAPPSTSPPPKNRPTTYAKWAQWEKDEPEPEENKEKIQNEKVLGRNAAGEKVDPEGAPQWDGPNPSEEDRLCFTEDMLEVCRESAQDMKFYFGGSKPPGNMRLPTEWKKPVGVLTVEQLGQYNCTGIRLLVSIYGDIFDVSHRKDLYGHGSKSHHAGKDITWGVVTGNETESNLNRFYDVFKLDQDHTGRYLQIICQRIVAFEEEFGEPVGRLEPFVHERELPPAPTNEIEECNQQ